MHVGYYILELFDVGIGLICSPFFYHLEKNPTEVIPAMLFLSCCLYSCGVDVHIVVELEQLLKL